MLYSAGLPNSTGQTYTGSVPLKVVNLSLGSIGGGCSSSYRNAISDVTDNGVTVVSSSGNSGEDAPDSKGILHHVQMLYQWLQLIHFTKSILLNI